jgi:hypothetical protein
MTVTFGFKTTFLDGWYKMTYSKSTLEALKKLGFNHPDYEG